MGTNKTTDDATARALMVLVEDLRDFETIAERLRAQITALAARHGVSLPPELNPSKA